MTLNVPCFVFTPTRISWYMSLRCLWSLELSPLQIWRMCQGPNPWRPAFRPRGWQPLSHRRTCKTAQAWMTSDIRFDKRMSSNIWTWTKLKQNEGDLHHFIILCLFFSNGKMLGPSLRGADDKSSLQVSLVRPDGEPANSGQFPGSHQLVPVENTDVWVWNES